MFKQYYVEQLGLAQHDFELFWAAMKEKLPIVFRVNANCPQYENFCAKIADE